MMYKQYLNKLDDAPTPEYTKLNYWRGEITKWVSAPPVQQRVGLQHFGVYLVDALGEIIERLERLEREQISTKTSEGKSLAFEQNCSSLEGREL